MLQRAVLAGRSINNIVAGCLSWCQPIDRMTVRATEKIMLFKTVAIVLILDWSIQRRFSLAQDCDVLPLFIGRMEKCLGKDMVADYKTLKCYPLGLRSGNCEPGELLMIDAGSGCHFPLSMCKRFHSPGGSACPKERPLVYEGKCRSTSWPCQAGSSRRTLQADYYGQVLPVEIPAVWCNEWCNAGWPGGPVTLELDSFGSDVGI
jgi:hypothetical protein